MCSLERDEDEGLDWLSYDSHNAAPKARMSAGQKVPIFYPIPRFVLFLYYIKSRKRTATAGDLLLTRL